MAAAASAPDWWRCSARKHHSEKYSKIQVGREIWRPPVPTLAICLLCSRLPTITVFFLSVVPLPVRTDLRSHQAERCPPVRLHWRPTAAVENEQ